MLWLILFCGVAELWCSRTRERADVSARPGSLVAWPTINVAPISQNPRTASKHRAGVFADSVSE